MKSLNILLLTLTVAFLPASLVHGSVNVLVNDTWLDGTRTDPAAPAYAENNGIVGTDADSDGKLESAWFKGGGGTLTPVGAGGPLRGSGYGTGSASWYTYFTQPGTPVTLGTAGEALRLTWVFTPSGVNANNANQGFNLAVVLAPTRVTGDASVPSAAYLGYASLMNMGVTLGNANPFQLRRWATPGGSGALLGTSGNWTSVGNGATSGNHGYDSDTQYTYEMTLTRNALNGLDIVSTMTGGTLNGSGSATVSWTDTAATQGFSFDMFDIRPTSEATTAITFDTSLFQIEFTRVPEPSSAALAGLAALSLALYRRVRR
jgi:hypothetical protein